MKNVRDEFMQTVREVKLDKLEQALKIEKVRNNIRGNKLPSQKLFTESFYK